MSKRNSYTVAYLNHSKQKRFGFIQYYLYTLKEIALAVICPLCVNLTPLNAFQLPPTCEYINDKIVHVSTDQCGVDHFRQ